MKKKFLIFTLCFTLIFSSFNYKKTYADAGVISLPMLATVATLGVSVGMVFNDIDDLYDIGHIFYNKNKMIWDTVVSTFNSCVAFNKVTNKLAVDKPFIDIFKNTFSDYKSASSNSEYTYYEGLSLIQGINPLKFTFDSPLSLVLGNTIDVKLYSSDDMVWIDFYNKVNKYSSSNLLGSISGTPSAYVQVLGSTLSLVDAHRSYSVKLKDVFNSLGASLELLFSVALPYSGVYDPSVLDDKEDIYLPGSLDSLVGGNVKPGDILGYSPFEGVSNGNVSLPHSSNPSISVDKDVSFPFLGDVVVDGVKPDNPAVPNQGIWANIKEFVISLVVPSDTFWTDTWGGLYGNFTSSFPMVDMDNFNKLVTGEKKFPNIDVNIMGVKGRIVNGDVVNSIVDWLRPIVAGFMMLCLMLFNYRKIYKLIRNSEPFGSVASGNNSDIRTGISEYSKHEVVKATDMVAEYHAWKERGGK